MSDSELTEAYLDKAMAVLAAGIDPPASEALRIVSFLRVRLKEAWEEAAKICEAVSGEHLNAHGKERMWGSGVDKICWGETTAMVCAIRIRNARIAAEKGPGTP